MMAHWFWVWELTGPRQWAVHLFSIEYVNEQGTATVLVCVPFGSLMVAWGSAS